MTRLQLIRLMIAPIIIDRLRKVDISNYFRDWLIVLTTAKPFSDKAHWNFVFACNCGSFRFRWTISCQSTALIVPIDIKLILFTELAFRLLLTVLMTWINFLKKILLLLPNFCVISCIWDVTCSLCSRSHNYR